MFEHGHGVAQDFARAAQLYERLGFYVAATRRHYYTNPVEDALILWVDLGKVGFDKAG